jgi:DNA-binding PadR family transcriptional regulator
MSEQLGRFEELILLALMRLGPDAYGVELRREIETRTRRDVSTGALYTALKRLENRGLVSSHVGQPTPERGGRRKRHYQLEASGIVALRDAHDDYQSMTEGLDRAIARAAARVEESS